jgi:peptidoglycan/xylan/chitin deacetylase (PgdA/CDA1 family)
VTEDEIRRRRRRQQIASEQRRRRRIGAGVVGGVLALIALVAISPWKGGDNIAQLVASSADADSEPSKAQRRRAMERRAVAKVLRYTTYVAAGRPVRPQVALTFDDGPGPFTQSILEILDRYGAKATFFNLGLQLDEFPKLTRKELRLGHAVGGHTVEHARMGVLSLTEQASQLGRQAEAFSEHGLPQPNLFRPPHGSFNSDTQQLLGAKDQLMVLWSTDTGDYQGPSAEVIAARALEGARPGAIILMHDAGGDRSQTVAALPRILDGLKERGLRAVTVPKLLMSNPPSRKQPPPVSLDLSVEPLGSG